MILVLLGTQNNSFHRLLEEIEKNIQNGNIKDKVIVQAGHTKFESENMHIFDMISQEKLDKLIEEADLVISHGGVGSMMAAIRKGKKVIAVPRLKKYSEHVNNHQLEIIDTFKKQGIIIGLSEVEQLGQALKDAQNTEMKAFETSTNRIVKIIDQFIENNQNKKEEKNGRRKNNKS